MGKAVKSTVSRSEGSRRAARAGERRGRPGVGELALSQFGSVNGHSHPDCLRKAGSMDLAAARPRRPVRFSTSTQNRWLFWSVMRG